MNTQLQNTLTEKAAMEMKSGTFICRMDLRIIISVRDTPLRIKVNAL